MGDIEKISVKKFLIKAEKLEKEYDVRLDTYRAEQSIRSHFITHVSHENNGLVIGDIRMSGEDSKALDNADTLAETRRIVKKYLKKDTKDMRVDQLSQATLPYGLLEKEANKMGGSRHYGAWDLRRDKAVPLGTIEEMLMKKTAKFIPFKLGDMTYGYQTVREINELIGLVCGIESSIDTQNYGESIIAYNKRLNETNPMMEIKVFQNGNLRLTFKDANVQAHFRQFMIEREMRAIIELRNQE